MKSKLLICLANSALWGGAAWYFFGLTFGIVAFVLSFAAMIFIFALMAVAG
jgi:hypothetical protein